MRFSDLLLLFPIVSAFLLFHTTFSATPTCNTSTEGACLAQNLATVNACGSDNTCLCTQVKILAACYDFCASDATAQANQTALLDQAQARCNNSQTGAFVFNGTVGTVPNAQGSVGGNTAFGPNATTGSTGSGGRTLTVKEGWMTTGVTVLCAITVVMASALMAWH